MANQTKRQNTTGGGLYIALAICILSVICIGVYSAIINIFDTSLDTPIVEEKNEQKIPISSTKAPSQTTSPKVTTTTPPTSVGSVTPVPEQNVNAQPEPVTYTMPVAGNVSKDFSHDILVYSETMNDYRVHNGVDIATTLGTPVKAFCDGVVLQIYEDPLMGQTVVLDHGNELKSVYQNLSPSLPEGIEVGVKVEEGQVIGGVGETGLIECAGEPHLHFEVLSKETPVDPMEYFK